nr:putative 145K replicase protein [Beet soil-borne virus]
MESTNILTQINRDDIIQAVLTTSASRTQSALHETLCRVIDDNIKNALKANTKKKIIDVKRNLSEEQVQYLCELYPERKIITSNSERGTHSMAAAMRKIETDLVLSLFPKNSVIYDIGGNWATHAKCNDGRKVHCCCPILDYRDAQRKMTRMLNFHKFISDSSEIPPDVREKAEMIAEDNAIITANVREGDLNSSALNGRWFCQNKFEDCVFDPRDILMGETAKDDVMIYAMAIHSIYDINVYELATALQRKGIKRMVGTFLFSVDMLLGRKSGELPSVNGFYKLEGEYIKYGFYDDPNCGYRHKFSSLKAYLTKTFVKAANGSVFYLELTDLRGDVMYFTMTDATEARASGIMKDESFKCIPVDAKNKVVFPLFVVDETTDTLMFLERVLPKDFVHRAIEYVNRCKENQLTVESIVSYLSSTNNAVIIGGSARKVEEKVDPSLLPMIASTLLVYSEMQRAKQKTVIQKLRIHVKNTVTIGDLLKHAFHKVFGAVGVGQLALQSFARWLKFFHGSGVIEMNDLFMYVEIEDRIRLWSKKSREHEFFLTFDDLTEKSRLYEEYNEERRRISDKIIKEKGLSSKDLSLEEDKEKTVDEILAWMEKSEDLKASELRSKLIGIRKNRARVDKRKFGEAHQVNTAVLQRFTESDDDHFSTCALNAPGKWWVDVLGEFLGKTLSEVCATNIVFSDIEPNDNTEGFDTVEYADRDDMASDVETSISQCVESNDECVDEDGYSCDGDSKVEHSTLNSNYGALTPTPREEVKNSEEGVDVTGEDVSTDIIEPHCDGRWALMAEDSDFAIDQKRSEALNIMEVRYAKLPSKPDYLESDDFRTRAKKEFIWYLECKLVADKSAMTDIVRDFVYNMYHNSLCEFPKNSCFLSYEGDDNGNWVWGRKPVRLGHAYAVHFYAADWKTDCRLVSLSWNKDEEGNFVGDKPVISTNSGVYMLCDLTFLMNEMIILKNLQFSLKTRFQKHIPHVTLIDGVPGCGKSTHIVKEARLENQYVLTMGREAAAELRERFKTVRGSTDEQLKRVRTVDSFLMNDKDSRAKVLHFDEALMAHAGMVYFCADNLSARTIICQGDSQQIPFINRVESITLEYAKLEITNVVEKRLTYRSPLDVACFLTRKNFYGTSTVMSANPTGRSMSVVGPRDGMTSNYSIPKKKGAQYLTFTQSEKEDMVRYLGKGQWSVNTVHESQGKTYDDVILVRLKPTDNEIYPGGRKSKPYVVVGTTRHRRSLVYYTRAEDILYRDITEMMSVQEGKLHKHLFTESTQ